MPKTLEFHVENETHTKFAKLMLMIENGLLNEKHTRKVGEILASFPPTDGKTKSEIRQQYNDGIDTNKEMVDHLFSQYEERFKKSFRTGKMTYQQFKATDGVIHEK